LGKREEEGKAKERDSVGVDAELRVCQYGEVIEVQRLTISRILKLRTHLPLREE